MQLPLPLTQDLVLIGGGHTHALVLRMWGMRPLAGVRVTVINPAATAAYSGMLPGFVAGHYSREQLDIDLVRLARFAGARIITGRAAGIDTDARLITLENGRQIPYHVASIDIGITSELPDLPGFAEFGIAAKPLDRFASSWAGFLNKATGLKAPVEIAVIGGGVGGVELSLAMQHALKTAGHPAAPFTLLESDTILKRMGIRVKSSLAKMLENAGITVIENATVSHLSKGGVSLENGRHIPSAFTVGAAGALPQPWLAETGLNLHQGFVSVGPTLCSVNVPDIFAVGDCAHLLASPRPKAGVFAVREAPVLYDNLRAALSGKTTRAFRPQKDYLKLISLGGKSAVADKWGLRVQGAALWRLKDRIDQKFMAQFHDLKPMSLPPMPNEYALGMAETIGDRPLCGGCGAKVGGTVLSQSLDALPANARADVVPTPGDDAAILKQPDGSYQVITTDHLRAFTNDPGLMARIAAVHALGDIWAMGATPQVAISTLILPPMSLTLHQSTLSEILKSANAVFAGQGAEIVGGHTSVGAELTIGFTVTGTCKKPVTLAGARPGDVLILTKPIGSGTILAGEMAMMAKGDWVVNALETMSRPQHDAAKLLSGAQAMTDVTGFGLAGHLRNLAEASGVGIELDLLEIPFLDGAEELAKIGVKSTIYDSNRMLNPKLDPGRDAKARLLFDPQTAGGLVAAVDAGQAGEILAKLKSLRFDARIIGRCIKPGADGPVQIIR